MKRVLAGLVFVLGMGTTVLLAEVVTGNAEKAIHQVLEAQSRNTAGTLRLTMEGRVQALSRLADRWQSRGGVPETEWRRDVRGYLKDYEGLEAMEWVDTGYVVRWAEPDETRRPMIGQNLGTEQRRRQALMTAIETRRPQSTVPLQLMGGGTGFLVYAPVFREGVFEGALVAVNRSGVLAGHLVDALQTVSGVALTIRHEQAVVYDTDVRVAARSDGVTTNFTVAESDWSVEARAGAEMVQAYSGYSQHLVLGVGSGLTILTALLLWLHGKTRERLLDVQVREGRLGLILDTAPDAILTFNEQGVIETSNATAAQIFGLSAADVPGLHLNRLIIRRDEDGQEVAEDRVWERAGQLETSGALFGVRGWVQEFPVEISVAERSVGERRLYTAIVRDISVRVASEAAQRRAEDILKAALDTIPEGFVVYDDHDRLVVCNEAYRRIYETSAPAIRPGSSFEEILRYGLSRGQYPQAGYTPEERQRWLMQRMRLHRSPPGPLLQQTNDGRWLRIEERLTDQGYVVGLRADVTDLMRAEEAIRASEARMRSLMETSPVGAVLVTEQDVVLYANRRIGELFRMPDNHFSLDFPEGLYADPAERGALLRDFERAGAVWDRPMQMRRRDGEMFWALVSVSRAPEQLNAHRIIWVYDIDESKRLAMELEASRDLLQQQAKEMTALAELNAKERVRAEAATRLKSEFLANVSHEIRTPMTGVLGLTDLLLASPLNAEQMVYATRLKRSGQTLLTLLNDILDFSKIEAGQLSLEQVDFSPVEVIEDVLTFLRPKAEEKRLLLQADLSADGNREDLVVLGDPTRLRQILFNLVGNAIKFTEDGGVLVKLRMSPGLEPEMLDLMLEIQDTGIGIPADRQQQIFEPFRQADSSTTRRFGGTGLGLAICRRLAELMGGEIRVFSRVGNGTTFTITLSLPEGNPDKAVSTSTAAMPMPVPVPGRSYRLLLAEDEETNRMLITIGLERLGHSVVAVPNGRDALAAIEEEDFDLLLLDMHMPLLDGPGVTSYVRMLPPPRCSMPVLALTADVLADQRRQYEEIGLDGYLTKPVDWQRMQEAILYWCRGEGIQAAPSSSGKPPVPAMDLQEAPAGIPSEPERRKGPPVWLREIIELVGAERVLPLMRSARQKLETGGEAVSCAFLRDSLSEGREAAHGLKGVARQFGALRTGEVAEELELSPYLGADDDGLIEALSRLELAAQADAVELGELIRQVESGLPPT